MMSSPRDPPPSDPPPPNEGQGAQRQGQRETGHFGQPDRTQGKSERSGGDGRNEETGPSNVPGAGRDNRR
jgi:hypothetical protein